MLGEKGWTRNKILAVSLALRLSLVAYSSIHDYMFEVKFTDIDYWVYHDAAMKVVNGGSPYDRATYRYSPLLAWMLIPNTLFIHFGKIIFCLGDLLVAWLCLQMSDLRLEKKEDEDISLRNVVIFWLFNILTFLISSRGNADSIVVASVLASLVLIEYNQWIVASMVHGALAIQLKLYPIILLPLVYFHFVHKDSPVSVSQLIHPRSPQAISIGLWRRMTLVLCNGRGLIYVMTCLLSFALTQVFFYYIYGHKFVQESLLHHFSRKDIRHNFSVYFYPLYLCDGNELILKMVSLGAFIPQFALIFIFAIRYSSDLIFSSFLSLFSFVAFNKVCTSQYFIWYISLLPIVASSIELPFSSSLILISSWFIGQGMWLFPAYLFEFRGLPTFDAIWIASLLFLLINVYILYSLITAYRPPSLNNKLTHKEKSH